MSNAEQHNPSSSQHPAAGEFLAGVSAKPLPPAKTSVETGHDGTASTDAASEHPRPATKLPERLHALLVAAATQMFSAVGSLYAHAQLNRARGSRTLKQGEGRGLFRRHEFTTGKRGAPITLVQITELGWSHLEPLGLKAPSPVVGGGYEHNLAAMALGAVLCRQGQKVRYEAEAGALQVDLLATDNTGQTIVGQIGISDPQREATNLEIALNDPALADCRLLLVCRDTAFRKKVTKVLSKRGVESPRVALMLVAEVLELHQTQGRIAL